MKNNIITQIIAIVVGVIIGVITNLLSHWPWYYTSLAVSVILNVLFIYMLNQDESNPDVEKFDKKQNRLQFKQNNTEVLIEQNEPIEPDKIITKLNALVSQDNK